MSSLALAAADASDRQVVAPLDAALRDCRILIVDDSVMARRMIESILGAAGFRSFAFAEDGIEALEQVVTFAPDLLVLDVQMPRMDGLEVCRQLRKDRDSTGLPILIQTGSSASEVRAEAFAAGATDVVAKPLQARELVARTRIQLENKLLVRNLSSHFDRLEQELDAAHKMQGTLLPSRGLVDQMEQVYGVDIEVFTEASELGGDIWGIWPLASRKLAFYLADFSGHGVVAALNVFRLHTLIKEHGASITDPSRFLGHLNDLLSQMLPTGQFATMIAGYIDFTERRLRYASAAAPPAVVLRDGGSGAPFLIDTAGLPLGISAAASYESREIAFGPDDYLLLYSDALIESPGDCAPALAEDGLLSLVESCALDDGVEGLAGRCLAQFFEDVHDPLGDDLTVVGISCPPVRALKAHPAASVARAAAEAPPAAHAIALAIGDPAFFASVYEHLPSTLKVELRWLALEFANLRTIAAIDRLPAAMLVRLGDDLAQLESLITELREDERLSPVPIVLVEDDGSDTAGLAPRLTGEALHILTRSELETRLQGALESALETNGLLSRLAEHVRDGESAVPLSGRLAFRTIEQVHRLASPLAEACPDPPVAVIGLIELMVNAIEHGNLEISYDEKTALLRDGTWHEELARRLALPGYRQRTALLAFDSDGERLRIVIKDQGEGFDPAPYLSIDASRIAAPNGRGIALVKTLGFDSVAFRGCGNEVEVVMSFADAARRPSQEE